MCDKEDRWRKVRYTEEGLMRGKKGVVRRNEGLGQWRKKE